MRRANRLPFPVQIACIRWMPKATDPRERYSFDRRSSRNSTRCGKRVMRMLAVRQTMSALRPDRRSWRWSGDGRTARSCDAGVKPPRRRPRKARGDSMNRRAARDRISSKLPIATVRGRLRRAPSWTPPEDGGRVHEASRVVRVAIDSLKRRRFFREVRLSDPSPWCKLGRLQRPQLKILHKLSS